MNVLYNRGEFGTSFWCVTCHLHVPGDVSDVVESYAALMYNRISWPLCILETATFKEGQTVVTVCLVRWKFYWGK
jgi:hypothetical protein